MFSVVYSSRSSLAALAAPASEARANTISLPRVMELVFKLYF